MLALYWGRGLFSFEGFFFPQNSLNMSGRPSEVVIVHRLKLNNYCKSEEWCFVKTPAFEDWILNEFQWAVSLIVGWIFWLKGYYFSLLNISLIFVIKRIGCAFFSFEDRHLLMTWVSVKWTIRSHLFISGKVTCLASAQEEQLQNSVSFLKGFVSYSEVSTLPPQLTLWFLYLWECL